MMPFGAGTSAARDEGRASLWAALRLRASSCAASAPSEERESTRLLHSVGSAAPSGWEPQ
eukprot:scaffold1830_cov246-Pinguiococcus_pyrenoidosus.AAC.18